MASSTPSSQPQDPPSASGPPPPAHIHILIGKVRRPRQQQQQQEQQEKSSTPPPPEYDPLWATFPMCRSTISYEGFQAAVSASADRVVTAAQQQHPEDKAAVTIFSPIGKYTVHHITPQPPNPQPGHFNPPPTSLLTLPSRRTTPPDPKRPIWVDFYIHSTPQPQPTGPDNQARFTSELLHHRLKTLNAKLSNGPQGRHNTLGLSEIPAAALQVRPPDPGPDGGDLVLTLPPISRTDWACAVEMHLLATTLNGLGPAPPPPQLMQEAVTQLGRLRDDGGRLRRESFEELLRCLGEGRLCLAYADDAAAAELEGTLRGRGSTEGGDANDDDDQIVASQSIPVEPGFMALMMAFLEENFFGMMEDEERASLQEWWARATGWRRGNGR